jgi:hypothetical protein
MISDLIKGKAYVLFLVKMDVEESSN